MAIVVNIQYSQNRDNRRLGTFSLSFIDEQNIIHSVDMKFGFEDLWTFAHDMESTAFDFLILSLVVYNVDRAINRLKFSLDGWHRSLIINCIPVKNVVKMQHAVTLFESAVNFLTGDTGISILYKLLNTTTDRLYRRILNEASLIKYAYFLGD